MKRKAEKNKGKRQRKMWVRGKGKKKKERGKSYDMGQCVGPSFFRFFGWKHNWVICAKWVGIGNWGILSDEWWVTKIEWGEMSDEKKKKKTKQPLSLFFFFLWKKSTTTLLPSEKKIHDNQRNKKRDRSRNHMKQWQTHELANPHTNEPSWRTHELANPRT